MKKKKQKQKERTKYLYFSWTFDIVTSYFIKKFENLTNNLININLSQVL
jgi:hypothetical protein